MLTNHAFLLSFIPPTVNVFTASFTIVLACALVTVKFPDQNGPVKFPGQGGLVTFSGRGGCVAFPGQGGLVMFPGQGCLHCVGGEESEGETEPVFVTAAKAPLATSAEPITVAITIANNAILRLEPIFPQP